MIIDAPINAGNNGLLKCPYDILHYDIMLFTAFCSTKHEFRQSVKQVVNLYIQGFKGKCFTKKVIIFFENRK